MNMVSSEALKYKLSDYNLEARDNNTNRYIFFNSLSGKMFSVNEDEYVSVKHFLSDINLYKSKFEDIFDSFLENGFIIREDVKEINKIKLRSRDGIFLDRNYHLFINPTLDCNFACWYCYEEHSKSKMSNETVIKIKRHLEYMVTEEKVTGIQLSWFGGEPLIYFKDIVYDISAFAKKLCLKYEIEFINQITTNGYLIKSSFLSQMKEINLQNFQITLDGDEENHDRSRFLKGSKKGTYEKIINNIKLLIESNSEVNIILRINFTNETLSSIDSILEDFDKKYRKNIKIDFQRIWQTYKEIVPTVNNLTLINYIDISRQMGYKVDDTKFAWKKVRVCYVDKLYHLEVNWDGEIYKRTARGYDKKYVIGKMENDGRINWNLEAYERHFANSTFENNMCLNCKLLPICMGPCIQKIIESNDNDIEKQCYLNNLEMSIDEYICRLYKQTINE